MIGRVAKLIARTQLTRGRLVFLLGMGAIMIVFGFIISATSGAGRYTDTVGNIDKFGIGVVAMVAMTLLSES